MTLASGINRHRFPLVEAILSAFDAEDDLARCRTGDTLRRVQLAAQLVDDIDGWRSIPWRPRPHWHPPWPEIPSVLT